MMNAKIRERLVELLLEVDYDLDTNLRGTMDVAYDVAEHLIDHGVTVQEWIPVSEPPDVHKTKAGHESVGVIVRVNGMEKSAYRIYERACVRGKTVYKWKYPWDAISDETITHWMPLPRAPKE